MVMGARSLILKLIFLTFTSSMLLSMPFYIVIHALHFCNAFFFAAFFSGVPCP